ncbi:DNA repair protein XRCC3-like isoform X2 [Liolophura sinensis]|uniref:DNA repair protein XRCC3-like isoform X2 n=1 Tax=Liolophura sinensis TaxID=3198878 RepID=UPI00315909F9
MDELDIHPRILTAVKRAHLNKLEDILIFSALELERRTKLSSSDVSVLKRAVAELIPKPVRVTALALHSHSVPDDLKIRKLTTGCPVLDKFLSGGIMSRGITEITGISASGKTQLCLQLGLTAQLPCSQGGLKGEDAFPNKRLYQMMQHFRKNTSASMGNTAQLSDSIFVEHVADVDGLHHCISRKLPVLLSRGAVKLVIIDSVAALFRCEFEAGQMVHRAKSIGTLGSCLHKLSAKFNIPVVCVNQVSDSFSEGASGKVVPALGLTWSNYVTTRLMLSRLTGILSVSGQNTGKPTPNVLRNIEILFSPHLPNMSCDFIIDQEGVKGIG